MCARADLAQSRGLQAALPQAARPNALHAAATVPRVRRRGLQRRRHDVRARLHVQRVQRKLGAAAAAASACVPPGECARTKRRFLDLLGADRLFKVIVTQRRRRRWAAAAARARVLRARWCCVHGGARAWSSRRWSAAVWEIRSIGGLNQGLARYPAGGYLGPLGTLLRAGNPI